MILVDIAVIVIGAAFLLRSPYLRNARTSIFLVVLAGALVASNLLPDPRWTFLMKAAALIAYLVGIVWVPHLLAGVSREDVTFDNRLRAIVGPVRAANVAWIKADQAGREREVQLQRDRTRATSAAAVTALSHLQPPNDRWNQAVELLREYLVAVSTRAEVSAGRGGTTTVPTNADIERLVQRSTQAWDAAFGARRK